MTRRLLVSYLLVTAVVLLLLEIPLAVFYAQREVDRLTSAIQRDATVIATVYEDDLERSSELDRRPAQRYHDKTGARVVVVDQSGIARVDTAQPGGREAPRDFSTRPEIVSALNGSDVQGKRTSQTLGSDIVYVAVPVASRGVVHGAVRITLSTHDIDQRIHRFWAGLLATAALVMAVMALVGWTIARSVTRPLRRLNDTAMRFAAGDLSLPDDTHDGPAELQRLSRTMSDMAEKLAATMQEQHAFVADASHQLRTPLTSLRLRLENLQSRLPHDQADELDNAIDETGRLSALVTDLLQLARADQHQQPILTDLALISSERVDTWSALADGSDVTLSLAGADRPVMVRAVPGVIEQILDNTLDNALNVTSAGSHIDIVVERGHGMNLLKIADHGPGLSDDDKRKATRRFWRAPTAPPGTGTGLGLAIAESLAMSSAGSLSLNDTAGGGLTVTLALPSADQ